MKYRLSVAIQGSRIVLNTDEVYSDQFFNNAVKNIAQQIVDTKDEQVKAALIKLGWTPPFVERRVHPFSKVKLYKTSSDPRIRALERRISKS